MFKVKRKNIIYDYSELLSKMEENRYSQQRLAKDVGMGRTSLNLKLNNKGEFSQKEVLAISELLGIKKEEYGKYFFKAFVQKTVQKKRIA